MDNLTLVKWSLLLMSAFIQGLSKGGIPGIAILAIPVVALIVPGKEATGLILPMLIAGDVMALAIWRKNCDRKSLLRALPWAVAGILTGWYALEHISDTYMNPLIGAIILAILLLQRQEKKLGGKAVSGGRVFPAFMGFLGGITTMLANAAGPVISAYLLSMRLPKNLFMGTCAWFFFIINWIKVPFMVDLNMITPASLSVNARMLPALIAGVAAGALFAKKVNQKVFTAIVTFLTFIAGVRLILTAFGI